MTFPIHFPRFSQSAKSGHRWIQAMLLFCLCLACACSIPQRGPAPRQEKTPTLEQVKSQFYNPTSGKPLNKREKEERADDKNHWIRAKSEPRQPVKYLGIHFRFKLGEKYFCGDQEFDGKGQGQLQLRGNVNGHLILVSKAFTSLLYSEVQANQLAFDGEVPFANDKEFLVFFSTEYPVELLGKIRKSKECAQSSKDQGCSKLSREMDDRLRGAESLVCDDSNPSEFGNYVVGIVSQYNKDLAFRIVPKFRR
jgi:hypothetical protein